MQDIKTKEYVQTIKTLDRAADLSERMKQVFIKTSESAQELPDTDQDSPTQYAEEQVQIEVENLMHDGYHLIVDTTKRATEHGKKVIREVQQRQTQAKNPQPRPAVQAVKGKEAAEQTVKQSTKATDIKTFTSSAKGTQQTIKTAEQSSKVAIKTAQNAATGAEKATQATAKAAAKTKQVLEATAKATAEAVKVATKATVEAIKAIDAGIKELVAAIVAGGWVSVIIIVVILIIALIAGSVYGIFFSSEDTGSELTMRQAVQQINDEYQGKLDNIRDYYSYDKLVTSGSRAVWPEVLSIYAVMTYTDPENPQEVATLDRRKQKLLDEIFWDMNRISYYTKVREDIILEETQDEYGNIVLIKTTIRTTTLYITVSHKSAYQMATLYGFTPEQCAMLDDLLADDKDALWGAVLYGIHTANEQLVAVAQSQIGNIGGQPYWSWYGFSSRVEWCACFVSWCANECGYIDAGVIPKFSGCIHGVKWFKDRYQWVDGDATPVPGMIIFFDWDSPNGLSGPQDGRSDHAGIVEKVENGRVYTIEGNRADSCTRRSYPIGYYQILGYGVPAY